MDFNNLLAGVTLTLPGWALVAAGFVVVLLLLLILRPRGDRSGLTTLAQLSLVAAIAGGAYFGLKLYEDNARFAERKAIEDRAALLLTQSSQPESVLGCLHVSLAPELGEACERIIFAEPQRITSAIAVIADRVSLLDDGTAYASREPSFAQRLEMLRRSLETDAYGIVAHVLAAQYRCIPDSCPRLRLFKDTDRIKANLENRTFDRLLVKHKESWAKNPASEQFGEVADILTLGIRPENMSGVNWGESESSEAPPAPFVPRSASAEPPSPPVRPADSDARNAKQKNALAKQKQQPVAADQKKQQPAQARKRSPEPVAGLPRVTSRYGQNEPDDDDAPPPSAPPPPPQERSPFNIFGR